ncbi:hypothetical protein NMH_1838 [Neisseria meningitidis H44/76]|uniref:Uncharacterized protein n=2 Tax=Neisseria meningitidis TaxID=487 RepID=E6MZG6_NEIMH|nr:hypothetical protein NEIPOLOT_02517 [Neisseria polysaccharea ATCC 43768]EFV63187.1 hypothetical protein NMH_1838 [Neisseria meningitidis H44/76]CBA04245.1 hypothetical protein predicted by Glimmer/Critica [Neisseria meningitidis alpha153]
MLLNEVFCCGMKRLPETAASRRRPLFGISDGICGMPSEGQSLS